ncbi:MAG TPA: hypothetical protein VGC09_22200 [Rhodopila sp.]
MRASLASATSLLALLLLDGREAVADPIVRFATAPPSYSMPGSPSEAGSDVAHRAGGADRYVFTPLAAGAATATRPFVDPDPYSLVGRSALAAGSADDGNPLVERRITRSVRAAGAGNSVFVGTTGYAPLLDAPSPLPVTGSASFGYTIPAPTDGMADVRRAGPRAAGRDRMPAAVPPPPTGPEEAADSSGVDGAAAVLGAGSGGSAASRPVAAPSVAAPSVAAPSIAAPSVAAPSVAAPSVAAPFVAAPSAAEMGARPAHPLDPGNAGRADGAGSGFAVFAPGASVFRSGGETAPVQFGAAPAKIVTGAVNAAAVRTLYRLLQRAGEAGGTNDGAASRAVAGDLAGAATDASMFNISTAPAHPAASQTAVVPVPIKVVDSGSGELPSSLTIFAARSTRTDEDDDPLEYFLDRASVR